MTTKKPGYFRLLSEGKGPIFLTVLLLLLPCCGRSTRTESETGSTLSPDERYIVQLYMKINELEKNLQDNPSDSVKKWEQLRNGVDSVRVRNILVELEKNPGRWLPVYVRIDELLEHENK